MALEVLITVRFDEAHLEKLKASVPDIHIHAIPTRRFDDVPVDIRQAIEVLYTASAFPPSQEEVPRLRWIQLHSAGANHLPDWLKTQERIVITTASGIHAVPMAEYTFMSILAWLRHLPTLLEYQRRTEWPASGWEVFAAYELRDMTMGILGYGSIGREIGRLAHAFGMRVLAMRRHGGTKEDRGYVVPGTGDPEGVIPAAWYTPDRLLEMLPLCDVVVNVLPLTPETYHMVNAKAFAAMKPGAYFVNIGRGATVDEAALVRALQEGRIAGAGLDVFEKEPLPPKSPLWKMKNVILSPHISALTHRYRDRAMDLFITNLRRYLKGAPLLNRFDPQLQY